MHVYNELPGVKHSSNSRLGLCFHPFLEKAGVINGISLLVLHCLSYLFSTLVCANTADKIVAISLSNVAGPKID